MNYTNYLGRSIAIADYILEDDGHTIQDACEEFNLSRNSISRSIKYLGSVAYYGCEPNSHDLKVKYLKVKKALYKKSKRKTSSTL